MSFNISGVCCDNGLIDPQFIKKNDPKQGYIFGLHL